MGYKADLLVWLRGEGLWDDLGDERRRWVESLTDDQAREVMVGHDQAMMGEIPEIAQRVAMMALHKLIALFDGHLLDAENIDAGGLSKAGRLLTRAILALRKAGLSDEQIANGMRELNTALLPMLRVLYKGPPDERDATSQNDA
ncbi:MAG TPA: hypothetical protein VG713_03975 [Pirellulales bacterium]|nr:hypothetical protein [Pirellulales bacterium]